MKRTELMFVVVSMTMTTVTSANDVTWSPASAITVEELVKEYQDDWYHIGTTFAIKCEAWDYDEWTTDCPPNSGGAWDHYGWFGLTYQWTETGESGEYLKEPKDQYYQVVYVDQKCVSLQTITCTVGDEDQVVPQHEHGSRDDSGTDSKTTKVGCFEMIGTYFPHKQNWTFRDL